MTYSLLFSSHRLLKVLYVIALVALALAFARPHWGSKWFGSIERRIKRLPGRRWLAIFVAGCFPLIVRALMLPWYPPPPPQIHDEFSYLLQADTFARGRVTNPTPLFWEHFETEYTLFQPTYASQYQPAQGLILAAGQVALHHPWWGVWLSIGLMCGSLCWALGYVVPPVWALSGALGAALQTGIFGLWMNSYFGGAVAASAGALVLGSLARMQRTDRAVSSGVICAAGIVLLFATRPVEGVIWSAVACVWVLAGIRSHRAFERPREVVGELVGAAHGAFRESALMWKQNSSCGGAGQMLLSPPVVQATPRRPRYVNALPAFLLVFLAGAAALAWYNWRVTGNPLDPPYLAYRRIYGTPQPYWWQPPVRADHFRYPELRNNYLNQVHLYNNRYSLAAIADAERSRLSNFWRFFVGPFLTPALLFLLSLRRDRRIRPWLLASIPFILDKATYHAWYPSQNAPATILIVLVLLQCWRHMRVWWRRRGVGVAMTRMLTAALCLTIVLGNLGRALERFAPSPRISHFAPIWEALYPARLLREDVTAVLERIPGPHLLFVKYGPNHCFCDEWVFNGADIPQQRIVYARTYNPSSDAALARYLGDHDVWIVEPDAKPYKLQRVDTAHSWP